MNFKQLIEHYESLDKKELIAHYETLPKEELIQKLVDKNTLLLKQENEIKRLNDENKNLKELETSHQQTNGQLHKEIKELREKQ